MSRYDANTVAALHEALDDEYKARATYAAVIERFGAVRPFVNIIAAEDRHARALERLLIKDGRSLPTDRWAGTVVAPATLELAYALGVQAEIDNRAMYDRLERMTGHADVLRVFGNLRAASQDNHLPAFQRHLVRTSADTGGKLSRQGAETGQGQGQGQERPKQGRGMGQGGGAMAAGRAQAVPGQGGQRGGCHRHGQTR